MKKGLSREAVTAVAVQLVRERGYWALSLRDVAGRLGVKPASLYNHVEGIGDIQLSVAEYAADMLETALVSAVKDKESDEALKCGACAYMDFAKANPDLYKALIHAPKSEDGRARALGRKTFDVFGKILHGYGIDEKNYLHLIRMLRCMLHGFFELCENGFLSHGRAKREDSFRFIVDEFIALVRTYSNVGLASGRDCDAPLTKGEDKK